MFFGDSITELGAAPGGYVSLIRSALQAEGPAAPEILGAGVSGNKVPDLEARLEQDVLIHHPSVVVIFIGINDVWHWALFNNGTTKERYERGMKTLVRTILDRGARVILCTPTAIGEKSVNPQDPLLDDYATVTRNVAADAGCSLCDLRAAFRTHLAMHNPKDSAQGILTEDTVHLNAEGNRLVAAELLKALRNEPGILPPHAR